MKKIKYLVFIIALFFIFNLGASALECYYSYAENNRLGTLTYTIFEPEGNSITEANIEIRHLGFNSEEGTETFNLNINNWNTVFKPIWYVEGVKIDVKGYDYYNTQHDCPPNAILYEWTDLFGFTKDLLAVSSDSHLNEFEVYRQVHNKIVETKMYIFTLKESISASEGGKGGSDTSASCASYTEEFDCIHSNKFACLWNETEFGNYCNTDNLIYVKCGDTVDIPKEIPGIVSFIFNLLKIATPIVLILVGMITLIKSITAGKEDEMTKAKNSLIKKVIAAVIVFFMVSIIQFVVSIVADKSESNNFSSCLNCFLNNECKGTAYYKTSVGGTYLRTFFKN